MIIISLGLSLEMSNGIYNETKSGATLSCSPVQKTCQKVKLFVYLD
jgi:hypothetical protein